MTDLRSLVLPLPTPAEQEAIVELTEAQLSVINHLEENLNAKLRAAQHLRQSILHHAFTGKLVPQDPSDEPATELLRRIAADRQERARMIAVAKRAGKQSAKRRTGRKPRFATNTSNRDR